jgi:hypothetical protein
LARRAPCRGGWTVSSIDLRGRLPDRRDTSVPRPLAGRVRVQDEADEVVVSKGSHPRRDTKPCQDRRYGGRSSDALGAESAGRRGTHPVHGFHRHFGLLLKQYMHHSPMGCRRGPRCQPSTPGAPVVNPERGNSARKPSPKAISVPHPCATQHLGRRKTQQQARTPTGPTIGLALYFGSHVLQ